MYDRNFREAPTLEIMKVEFSGGLETAFGGRTIDVNVPKGADMAWLLAELATKASDPSLFLQDGHVLRPGVLALVNDTDWEILGEEAYVFTPGDIVHFASTLHGG